MKQKLNPLDRENLRQVILNFPDQFKIGFELGKEIKIKGNFSSVCHSGMGGSSLPMDLVGIYIKYLREKNPKKNASFRIFKNRGYTLPIESKKNCLHIFASYSGNTEETLESLSQAIKSKLPSIGMAHGGKLVEICQKNNIPCIIVPEVSQPRYATGYFFSAILAVLSGAGLLEKNLSKEILDSIDDLKKDTKKLEKIGLSLAKKISGKTPVIHVSEKMKAVGRIGKIKINENSKTPCFFNFYPELNHNEMVGFSLPQAKFFILTVLDETEHPQIIKRMRITEKLLGKKGLATQTIKVPDGKNLFLRLFSSLAVFDWISYYLALEYGQDPTPVDMVEDLKKMLQ